MNALKIVVALVVLLSLVALLFQGPAAYSPVQRVIIFALIALLSATLVASEATTRFSLELPGFLLTATGTAAFFLGILVLLNHLAKPELQVAAFDVYRADRATPVMLDYDGAYTLGKSPQGLAASIFTRANEVLIIFPEQVTELAMTIRETAGGPLLRGTVTYTGTRRTSMYVGSDFQ